MADSDRGRLSVSLVDVHDGRETEFLALASDVAAVLSRKGYGIHGTNEPELIGQQVSHGCIRMLNEDVEELFDVVSIGTPVSITD